MPRQTLIGWLRRRQAKAKAARQGLAEGGLADGAGASAAKRWPMVWRASLAVAVVALIAVISAFALYGKAVREIGPLSLTDAEQLSVSVVDRDGKLLRPFTTADGRWRLPLEPDHVDQRYLKILMAFEDVRFYQHRGVDAHAVTRAVLQAARHGRLVSGASTLTMQVARLVDGKHERTGSGKLRQIARAIQLEKKFSKTEILRLYLRLAPFGGNIEGVRAASLTYFGKEPRRLSIGEAALLVALPQSPEARRPDRHPEAAKRARARVLDRAVVAGVINTAEAEKAKSERMPLARLEFPKLAPHLGGGGNCSEPGAERAHVDSGPRSPKKPRNSGEPASGAAWATSSRPPFSLPITTRARYWRKSDRPDISTLAAPVPSIWQPLFALPVRR